MNLALAAKLVKLDITNQLRALRHVLNVLPILLMSMLIIVSVMLATILVPPTRVYNVRLELGNSAREIRQVGARIVLTI
jgi:hypothetical protein